MKTYTFKVTIPQKIDLAWLISKAANPDTLYELNILSQMNGNDIVIDDYNATSSEQSLYCFSIAFPTTWFVLNKEEI